MSCFMRRFFSRFALPRVPRVALACLVVALVAPAASVAAVIDLGAAGKYAAFGLGSTMAVGTADSILNNTAQIYGDVAVGADTGSLTAAGHGTFQKGFITGSLYVDGPTTPASYQIVNKNFTVSGTVFGTTPGNPGSSVDSVGTGIFNLAPAVQAAMDKSAFYASQGGTALGNYSFGAGTHVLNAGVYSATNLNFNSGAVLEIHGGPTDTFVLNDSGGFSFAKSFIHLTGGITSANVLFNVTGADSSSAGTASISGDNTVFFGTLLAVSRNIDIQGVGSHNGSIQGVSFGTNGDDGNPGLEGRVIGALGTDPNNPLLLQIYSGAEINYSGFSGGDVPEPSTVVLGVFGLAGLAIYCCRPRRPRMS